MKQFIGAAAAVLLSATASAQQLEARGLCDNAVNDGGNWYCSMVKAITYNGVGVDNKYNKITNMDGNSGSCESTPVGYSGSMSPLDEEVRHISHAWRMMTRHAQNPRTRLLTIPRSPCTSVVPPS
jgi:hypothetical protein